GGDGRTELRHGGAGGCRRGRFRLGHAELLGEWSEHALPVFVHRTRVAQETLEHFLRVTDVVGVKNRRWSHGSLPLLLRRPAPLSSEIPGTPGSVVRASTRNGGGKGPTAAWRPAPVLGTGPDVATKEDSRATQEVQR